MGQNRAGQRAVLDRAQKAHMIYWGSNTDVGNDMNPGRKEWDKMRMGKKCPAIRDNPTLLCEESFMFQLQDSYPRVILGEGIFRIPQKCIWDFWLGGERQMGAHLMSLLGTTGTAVHYVS